MYTALKLTIVDPQFFQFSWVGGKVQIKYNLKIYNAIQNGDTTMHFLDQNLKIKTVNN